ncbi:tRNA wybutosine-synthesizing protein 2 homolog [Physella acuta]|uniref:tRNA wybutosine-synthesizing protein 2 homolog n=1 Tax=Physella acuta TaxID=109671 RepID=UPI0027DBC63C|nr:tRNA wybutosine-synthesizing protein 2 homolog [Physella acuta]
MVSLEESPTLLVPSESAQLIRQELEKLQLWDSSHKLQQVENNLVAIPVNVEGSKLDMLKLHWPDLKLAYIPLPVSKKVMVKQNTPAAHLMKKISELMEKYRMSEKLKDEVPHKWERHGNLVILPSTAFISNEWKVLGELLWEVVAKCLKCRRLARQSPVADNGFRSSQVVMLLGEDGVVTHVDNGISYVYDVTKCMFSAGNITEKLRIAKLDCVGETIVDLYAGIGYFTLPYLIHAKADHVFACEWNPDAVSALRNNLKVNGVFEKCTVIEGDNRKLQLRDLADRVNLGLIPSSEESWPMAVQVLKPTGGVLHIHGNVTTRKVCLKGDGSKINGGYCVSSDLPQNAAAELVNEVGSFFESGVTNHDSKDSCISSLNTQYGDLIALKDKKVYDRIFTSNIEKIDSSETHLSCIGLKEMFANENGDLNKVCSKTEKENIKQACWEWSMGTQVKIKSLLEESKGGKWSVQGKHLELVKWYAPHVLHVVADILCRPESV